MSYTGTEIFNQAIALIDSIDASGAILDADVSDYKHRAPFLLDLWQHEMMKIENISSLTKVTALTQTMQVSDAGCVSGAYFLAMHFALSDNDTDMAPMFRAKYEETKKLGSKPRTAVATQDVYWPIT